MKKIPFALHTETFTPKDIKKVLSLAVNEKNFTGNNKGEKFLNVPVSFDIETTSFYRDADGETYTYDRYIKLGGKQTKMEKCSLLNGASEIPAWFARWKKERMVIPCPLDCRQYVYCLSVSSL